MSFLPARYGGSVGRRVLFAILIMVTGGLVAMDCADPPQIRAQSANRSGKLPVFEVASVNIAKTGDIQEDREDISSSLGSLTMRHVSLKSCMKWAYGVKDFQISGPAWLGSDRFDIVA